MNYTENFYCRRYPDYELIVSRKGVSGDNDGWEARENWRIAHSQKSAVKAEIGSFEKWSHEQVFKVHELNYMHHHLWFE